jgi:hypothetical protein
MGAAAPTAYAYIASDPVQQYAAEIRPLSPPLALQHLDTLSCQVCAPLLRSRPCALPQPVDIAAETARCIAALGALTGLQALDYCSGSGTYDMKALRSHLCRHSNPPCHRHQADDKPCASCLRYHADVPGSGRKCSNWAEAARGAALQPTLQHLCLDGQQPAATSFQVLSWTNWTSAAISCTRLATNSGVFRAVDEQVVGCGLGCRNYQAGSCDRDTLAAAQVVSHAQAEEKLLSRLGQRRLYMPPV